MKMNPTPICLRREINVESLCRENPLDGMSILGSFWPNSRTSFESHLVKAFKDSNPVTSFEPHISQLCDFYALAVLNAVGKRRFTWVCRVLSSGETQPERTRPQSLLLDCICAHSRVNDITHLFYKSNARPPMRTVPRLSGPDALRSRIQYVIQDLFIRPANLGGAALLVDDIMNTGASMRVYARALIAYAGVETVFGVNLAVTRFAGGKDGYGMLRLDTSALRNRLGLAETWIDAGGIFHSDFDCDNIRPPAITEVRFMAERRASPCPRCSVPPLEDIKYWHAF